MVKDKGKGKGKKKSKSPRRTQRRPTLVAPPRTMFGIPPPQPSGQRYFHDPGADFDQAISLREGIRRNDPANPYKTTKKRLRHSQFQARSKGYRPRIFTVAEKLHGLKHTPLEAFMIKNYKTRANIRPAVIRKATKKWLKKNNRTPKTITRMHSVKLPSKTKRKTKKLKTV